MILPAVYKCPIGGAVVSSIVNSQERIQRGGQGARGPGPSLSDHTPIIKFCGPVLT